MVCHILIQLMLAVAVLVLVTLERDQPMAALVVLVVVGKVVVAGAPLYQTMLELQA
jgi:hypothetical protein